MVNTVKLNAATSPAAVSPSDPLKNVNITAGNNDAGEGGLVNILGGNAIAGDNSGGGSTLQGGVGSGSGSGGSAGLAGGIGGATGAGGGIYLNAGAGAAPSGTGGIVNIECGTGPGGVGFVRIAGANGPNATNGGNGASVNIESGFGGSSNQENGDAGNGGNVVITLNGPGAPAGIGAEGVTGHLKVIGLEAFADDTAAATGGVPVGGLYRTASVIKIRVA